MKSRNGQVIIILLFFIPPILFLLFSVANTVIAVRDRVRLQNSADAAVMSAAAWQGNGLNQLAEANTVITAIDLLDAYFASDISGSPGVRAKRLILAAERQQISNVKKDIIKRIPGFAAASGSRNGYNTLKGNMLRGGGAGGMMQVANITSGTRVPAQEAQQDIGANVFGIERDLAYKFELSGGFDPEANRIFAIAWRKRALSGVAKHMFGMMTIPSGYALSSAYVKSKSNVSEASPNIPDYTPSLTNVRLGQNDFNYLKDNYLFIIKDISFDALSNNILH